MMLDEPIADIAAFGHYAVPKFCAENNIKVLLTGIGGDELFWGYDWSRASVELNQNKKLFQFLAALLSPFMRINIAYKLLFKLSRTRKIPTQLRSFFRKTLGAVDQKAPTDQHVFMASTGAPEFCKNTDNTHWHGSAMKEVTADNAYKPTDLGVTGEKSDIPTEIINMLFKTWLVSNCLNLGDRVSMATNVETRLPFLDAHLIETVTAWRKSNPDHQNGQKAVLREILSDVLPEKTIKRPKSGFVPPVMQWIAAIAEHYGHTLENGHLVQQKIADQDVMKRCRSLETSPFPGQGLYRIILLETWYNSMVNHYTKSNSQTT